MLPLLPIQSGGMAAALQMDDAHSTRLRDRGRCGPGDGAERESEYEVEIHSLFEEPITARGPRGG
jgi:hypothetical protein